MASRDNRTAFHGAMAGIISGIMLQPLEVLKINLILMPKQFDVTKNQNFLRAFFSATKIIYREEKLMGFYRGTIPSVLSSGLSAGLYFTILRKLEHFGKSRRMNDQVSEFLASATARSLASCMVNPLNVWKTRAEILGFNDYRSTKDSVRKIYQKEGVHGFFKGTLLMMLRDFPFGGIFYVTYKFSNHILHSMWENHLTYLISGIFSGVVATTITHPVEIILAKTQADTTAGSFHKRKPGTMFREISKIYSEEGTLALFKGLFPRLIRKPITNAMTFFFFEVLTRNKPGTREGSVEGEYEDNPLNKNSEP